MNIAAIVLAAGGSTRLGSPKQLLEYGGRSLLRRAAQAALGAGCWPVIVMLGSGAERMQMELADLDVHDVINPRWGDGMGTSVRMGLETLNTLAPDADGALLTLCDQPLVGPAALAALLEEFRRAEPAATVIVAAWYDGATGAPAVFGRAHFDELRAVPDRAGAKPVLRQHHASVIEVPLPEAATDIDTRDQYDRLTASPSP